MHIEIAQVGRQAGTVINTQPEYYHSFHSIAASESDKTLNQRQTHFQGVWSPHPNVNKTKTIANQDPTRPYNTCMSQVLSF
jgi:capsule polysaccharide export protein KpsC/LpsZ